MTLAHWKKSYDKLRQHIEKQRYHFADKRVYSQSYSFSISHVRMWELDKKEGGLAKNWWFWIVVLEKTLEKSLGLQGDQTSQPWPFIGMTDAETETPILWPPYVKSWLIGKDMMLGKIEGKRRRGQQSKIWWDSIMDSMDMNLRDSVE